MKAFSALLFSFLIPSMLCAQEICNNGLDDDNDGLIDLNDPDCPCSTLLMGDSLPSYIRNHSFEERGCCPLGFVSPFGPPWLDCATGWHQATSATSDYFNECGYSPAGFNLPPPDGDGAVGFYAMPAYKEYVGTCLTWPLPSNPLLAGTTYTISLWISAGCADDQHTQTPAEGASTYLFPDQLPLAIFGYANECVEFPIATDNCIGDMPGWNELGRTYVQPSWDWVRVSITFTPAQEIHSIIIGSACDLPLSFNPQTITADDGSLVTLSPYFIVDDLMLTLAGDQVLSPTSTSGSLCAGDAAAVAMPPSGATGYQWYLNGVALPGQNSTSLDISGAGLGAGLYTMASTFNGQCLMGSASIAPASMPSPWPALLPASGCAPLTVAFTDTSGGGTSTVSWQISDGTTTTDSAFVHTFTTPGSYDVRLEVANDAGCTRDTLLVNAITVFPGDNAQINADPNPVNAEDPNVTLSGSGNAGIISWWWDLGSALPPTSDQQNVSATFPNTPGDYPVMLVVATANGCVDTVQSLITVIDPGVIEMPNVFSPNGDGHNDRFIPIGYKGAPGMMEIYNRWGQMIFTTRNLAQGWSGLDAPDGTYFFIVTPDQPGVEALTGHVTLVR
jgi:gliding motility-associated-like protein